MGTITAFPILTTSQPPPFPVGPTISAPTYTFSSTDPQTVIPFNTLANNAIAATIPQGFCAVGSQLTGIQYGPGLLTFVGGQGVSLLPGQTIMAGGQYALMGVMQLFPDVWVAFGNYFPVTQGIIQFATVGFAGSGGA